MSRILLFMALVTTLPLTIQACSKGCLTCDFNTDKCELCDFVGGYHLFNGECVRSFFYNCVLFGKDGKCKICAEEFYVDQFSGMCLEIPKDIPYNNCEIYGPSGVCMECRAGYYWNSKECVLPINRIDKCVRYRNDSQCKICQSGYLPSIEETVCILTDLAHHCKAFSYVKCDKCPSGYEINHNLYLKYEKETWFMRTSETKRISEHVCQPRSIGQCKFFDEYDNCLQCVHGYYYDEILDQCIQFPNNPIPNCTKYKSIYECRECAPGFYLRSPRDCAKVKTILNCQLYDPSATVPKCLACEKGYFINTSRLCQQRTYSNSIPNCIKVSDDSDTCSECADGSHLSKDKRACLNAISNCVEYYPIEVNGQIADERCSVCTDGYFVQSNMCIKGTVEGCKVYISDKNQCQVCNNGRYLNKGQCEVQEYYRRCQVFSSSEPPICLTCSDGTYDFSIKTSCMPIDNQIESCEIYESQSKCSKCLEGTYLQSNKQACTPQANLIHNCEEFDSKTNKCTRCIGETILFDGGFCGDLIEYVYQYCQVIAVKGMSFSSDPLYQCSVCAQGTLPYEAKGHSYCIEQRNLRWLALPEIPNCNRYHGIRCLECKSPFILSANLMHCVEKCDYETQLGHFYSFNSSDSPVYLADYICIEQEHALGNCEFSTLDDFGARQCVTCKQGFYPIVDLTMNSFVAYPYGTKTAQFKVLNGRFPGFRCASVNETVAHCLYYFSSNDGPMKCLRCENGYHSVIDSATHSIKECVKMDDCDSEKIFGGLQHNLSSFYSCHRCTGDQQLPTLAIRTEDPSNIENRGWKTVTLGILPNSNSGLSCLSSALINSVEHCGLAAYDTRTSSYICTACNPGSRPIYGDDGREVKRCLKIAHCSSESTMLQFNGCSDCVDNTAFLYSRSKTIESYICVKTTSENCLVSDLEGKCFYCKKGYYLNPDNICEKFHIHGCTDPDVQSYYDMKDHSSFLRFFFGRVGCNFCKSGYSLVYDPTPRKLCIKSQYLLTAKLTSKSNLIKHCDNYQTASPLKCEVCTHGYIPTENRNLCVLSMPNCMFASGKLTKTCAKCFDSHVSVDGQCVIKDIAHCILYDDTSEEAASRCLICERGFFLSSPRECLVGKVTNCSEFANGNPNKCNKCLEGYIKTVGATGDDYCFPSPSGTLNCAEWNHNEFKKGYLRCNKCQSGFLLVDQPEQGKPLSICLSITPIANCKKYDGNSIATTTFNCQECERAFYVNKIKRLCLPRTGSYLNCKTFVPDEDKCAECIDTAMLNQDRTECISLPIGIYGCVKYTEGGACSVCGPGLYLSDNTCKEVKRSVSDCQIYLNESTCAICRPGYYMDDGECFKASLPDCKTYNNKQSCDTCHSGWGLVLMGKNWHCVPIQIQNCEQTTSSSPFMCLKCRPGHYSNAKGHCALVKRPIPGCIYYSSESTCSLCINNSALSIDGKLCDSSASILKQINPYCEASSILIQPRCTRCELGYYIFNNRCIRCDADPNCLACNPEFPAECLICKTGFFMTRDKECLLFNDSGIKEGQPVEKLNLAEKISAFLVVLVLTTF